jgi:hypothetical protein
LEHAPGVERDLPSPALQIIRLWEERMKTWKTSLLLQVVVGGMYAAPALAADPNAMVREALAAQSHGREVNVAAPAGASDELGSLGKALAARARAHGVDPLGDKATSQSPGVTHPIGDRTAEDRSAPATAPASPANAGTRSLSMPALLGRMENNLTDRRVHAQTQAQMAAMGGSGGSEAKGEDRQGQSGRAGSSVARSSARDLSMPALLGQLEAGLTDRRVHAQTQAQMAALGGSGGSEAKGEDRQGQATTRGGTSSSNQPASMPSPTALAGGVERAHFSPQQQSELRVSEEMSGREREVRTGSTTSSFERPTREIQVRPISFEHADRVHLPQAFYR